MFTTPQDFYNESLKFYNAFPKTPADVQNVLEKTKKVITKEVESTKEVVATYNKALTGKASMNEITDANRKAQELFTSARFAAYLMIPGAIFTVPAVAEMSKELGVEFIPKSVADEFKL